MVATRVAEIPYKWRLECEKHGRNCWFSSQPCLMTPEGLTYRWNQYVPHCPTTNLSENCYPTNISIHIQHKTCPNVAQCSWRYKWSNIGNDSWHLMMFIVTVCSIPLISNKYQVYPHEFRGISQETSLHVSSCSIMFPYIRPRVPQMAPQIGNPNWWRKFGRLVAVGSEAVHGEVWLVEFWLCFFF